MRRPTARERIVIVVGVLAIAGAWVVRAGGPRWLEWRADTRAHLHSVERAAREASALLRALPDVVDSLADRSGELGARMGDFVIDPSPDAAQAQLASIVSDAAAIADVRLDALTVSADSTETHGVSGIRVVVRGAGDVRGVASWLSRLEAGTPLIRLEALSITQPDASAEEQTPEELSFDATFLGLHLDRPKSEDP